MERDGRFAELTHELRRRRPEPSEALRMRVGRIAEQPAPPSRLQRQSPSRRRNVVLALAGAGLVAAVAGGIVIGSRGNGGTQQVVRGQLPAGGTAAKAGSLSARAAAQAPGATVPAAGGDRQAASPLTTTRRLAELRAELTLRVASQRALADATGRAQRIVRGSGGYVVKATYNSASAGAGSFLELRVPAAQAQSVLARLSRLGELLAQNVQLEDLRATVDAQTGQITALQAQIAGLERSLKDPSLSSRAQDQLRVEVALKRSQLQRLLAERRATRARGVYATVSLTLTTDRVQVVAPPGRIHQAFDQARDGLAREIAWVVRAAVVGAPAIVLALLLWAGLRQRRRRLEQRLLARS
jgi:hypothetical protein